MYPNSIIPASEENAEEEVVLNYDGPLFIGGGRTISAVYGGMGNKTVVGYTIEVQTPSGRVLQSYPVSLEEGRSLIHTAVSQMSAKSTTASIMMDEVAQSILPVQVAFQYVNKLKKMGVPTEELPKSVEETFAKIERELRAFLNLGKVQISLRTQQVQDSLISLALQVYSGNNTIYDGLPKEMKEKVDYMQQLIMVMAVENSGFSEETLRIHRQMVEMKLTENAERIDALAERSPQVAQAIADSISRFFGGVVGGTIGAVRSAFKRNDTGE